MSFSRRRLRRSAVRRGVLRHFAKFTGKHQCQSLFLIKLQAWVFSWKFSEIFKNTFLQSTSEHLLWLLLGKRQFLFSYFIIVYNMMKFLVIPIIIKQYLQIMVFVTIVWRKRWKCFKIFVFVFHQGIEHYKASR